MADFVERVILRVGGVDLDDVIVSVSEKAGKPGTPVNTMNRARVAKGFKRKNAQYALDVDAERIDDPRVPDWHALMASDTKFAIVVTPNVGKSITYGGCIVTEVTDGTSDGESSRKVQVLARTRK